MCARTYAHACLCVLYAVLHVCDYAGGCLWVVLYVLVCACGMCVISHKGGWRGGNTTTSSSFPRCHVGRGHLDVA